MKRFSFIGFMASMPAGLSLFAAVAAVSALGSFIPAWGSHIYKSWWFASLLALLVANTGFCAVRQTRGLLRGSWRVRLVWLVHVSVLILALACAWAARTFRMDPATVAEGESFAVGADTWTLEKISVLRYPDGSVSDWVSRVATPSGRAEILVNHPLASGSVKVLQSGYQRSYTVTVTRGALTQTVILDQDVEAPLTADGSIGFALTPPQDGVLRRASEEEGLPETVDLLLTSQGRILQRSAMYVGLPLELGDTGLHLTVESSRASSTFLIRDTPGLPFVWFSFALFTLSVTALMLYPRPRAKESHRA